MANVREYREQGTDADPSLLVPEPPAYTPEPPLSPQEVLEHAHPPREPSTGSAPDDDDDYRNLVKTIGIRCKLYEEELERKRLSGEKISSRLRRKRSQTYSGSSADERGEALKWVPYGIGAAGAILAGE